MTQEMGPIQEAPL